MINQEKSIMIAIYKIFKKISLAVTFMFLISCELSLLQQLQQFEDPNVQQTDNIGLKIYQLSKFPERDPNLAPYGVQEIYYSPPTDDGESYMYLSYATASKDNPFYNVRFIVNFIIDGSCTADRLYHIENKDMYMLKKDGTKIAAYEFEGVGSECIVNRVSSVSGNTVLDRKFIRFLMPLEYLEQGTKLIIAKIYKKDKVIMKNIEYRFEIYETEDMDSFLNPKFSIKLPSE